jgi:hypothetical protein
MTEKPKTPFIVATRTQGFAVGVAAIAFGIIAGVLVGDDVRGEMGGLSLAAIALVIFISWPLRKELWFWIVVTIFAVIHALAVIHFDWSFTRSWTGRAMGSLIYPDVGIMMGVIYAAYRLIYGAPTEVVGDTADELRYAQRDLEL